MGGIRGGVFAGIMGGDFRSGFTGGFTEGALGRFIGKQGWGADPGSGTVIAGFISGTVSEVTGGKFAVGAFSGAMGYLFNEVASGGKGNETGVLGHNKDGIPIFDESSPRFHNYYNSNSWLKSSQGCTYAAIGKASLRYPTPGASGALVSDEQITLAFPVGWVRHEVQLNNYTVINVTVSGRHLLSPGIVRRWVTESANKVTIHTYGEGTGMLPGINEVLSKPLWHGVDNKIFDYARKN